MPFDFCRPSSSLKRGGGPLTGLPVSVLGAFKSTNGFRAVVDWVECEEWEVPGRRGKANDDKGASSSESEPGSDSDVSLPGLRARGRGVALGVADASETKYDGIVKLEAKEELTVWQSCIGCECYVCASLLCSRRKCTNT